MMTRNGTAKVLLVDYQTIFFFNKEKFCKKFSVKAQCGNKAAGMIKKIIFESNLYDHCNTGTVPFEWLYDCAFTAVKAAHRTNMAHHLREELYPVFSRIWNDCLFRDKKITRGILKNVKVPIALIAVANPVHCAKIKESDFVKKRCLTTFLHSPVEECDLNGIIKKLAEEVGVSPDQFIYIGNNLPQTLAEDPGVTIIRYHRKAPAHIIRKQLAHHGLI